MILVAGRGSGAVLHDDQGDVMIVEKGIDDTRKSGMEKGGVSQKRHHPSTFGGYIFTWVMGFVFRCCSERPALMGDVIHMVFFTVFRFFWWRGLSWSIAAVIEQ